MANYKVIEIKQSVFSSNEKEANNLRKELKEKGTRNREKFSGYGKCYS